MPEILLTINGHGYQMTCDDGEEQHLVELARYLDKRVVDLVKAVGQVGEGRLLVMAGLLLADELQGAYAGLENVAAGGASADDGRLGQYAAHLLDHTAERLELIAARLVDA